MALRRKSIAPKTESQVLYERIEALEKEAKQLRQAGPSTIQTFDHDIYADPVFGEVQWHFPNQRGYIWHQDAWRPLAPPSYHIKVFGDDEIVTTVADRYFVFNISPDMDGFYLYWLRIYVSTPGSCTVQLKNLTQGNVSMLSTPATIDSGEYSSRTATVAPVIHPTDSQVFDDDRVSIQVTAAGGACKGLGIQMVYNPFLPA